MNALLKFVAVIDAVSSLLGRIAAWAVLLASLISAGNAVVRYGLDMSSNAWLEIQWYLFAATVMLAAPTVLRLNEHVRVDILYIRRSGRMQVWTDIWGTLILLLPVMAVLTWLTWQYFLNTWTSGEVSGSIGGLTRWPAALLMPVGFAMIFLQGVAEIIKRVAYLRGQYTMAFTYEKPLQ